MPDTPQPLHQLLLERLSAQVLTLVETEVRNIVGRYDGRTRVQVFRGIDDGDFQVWTVDENDAQILLIGRIRMMAKPDGWDLSIWSITDAPHMNHA